MHPFKIVVCLCIENLDIFAIETSFQGFSNPRPVEVASIGTVLWRGVYFFIKGGAFDKSNLSSSLYNLPLPSLSYTYSMLT